MNPIVDGPSFDQTYPAAQRLLGQLAQAFQDWDAIEAVARPHLALVKVDRRGGAPQLWARVLDAGCLAGKTRAFLEAFLSDPGYAALHAAVRAVLAVSDGPTPVVPDVRATKPDIGSAKKALAALVVTMFTPDELREVIRYGYPGVETEINWVGGSKAIAFDTVETLSRHGHLRAPLFQEFEEARPMRSDEIRAVAAGFGV